MDVLATGSMNLDDVEQVNYIFGSPCDIIKCEVKFLVRTEQSNKETIEISCSI